jgi:hypothetical protein
MWAGWVSFAMLSTQAETSRFMDASEVTSWGAVAMGA